MEVGSGVQSTVSPLSDDADEKDPEVGQDNDVADCPTYRTVRLAAAILGPPCVSPLLRLITAAGAFLTVWTAEPFDEEPLAFLMNLFAMTGGFLIATNTIAIRSALVDDSTSDEFVSDSAAENEGRGAKETTGALQKLGYGRTRISLRNKKRLDRGAYMTLPVVVFFFLLTVANMVSAIVMHNTRSALTGRMFTTLYGVATWLFNFGFCGTSVHLTLFAFHALKIASVLVGDAVMKVIHKVRELDPKDPRWQTDVVEPSLLLATKTFPTLSAGFGPMVALSGGGLWLISAAFLCRFLVFHGLIPATMVAIFAFTPILMASDIAAASSLCDTLRNELNKKRLENLDAHDEIYRLEYALDRLNE